MEPASIAIQAAILYSECMSTLAEIEGAIKDLPEKEFSSLWEWMNSHAAQRGIAFENSDLETALINTLESPRLEMNDGFFAEAREFLNRRRKSHAG